MNAIDRAIKQLKEQHVLMTYNADIRREGRKIVETLYTLTPSPLFVKEALIIVWPKTIFYKWDIGCKLLF